MIVRCTKKLLDLLAGGARSLSDLPAADEDWYANLLWIDREKCLLLTHAGTLFSVVMPGVRVGELRPIGPYVVAALRWNCARRTCRSTPSVVSTVTRFVSPERRAAAPSAS